MCIIIYKPEGMKLDEKVFVNSFFHNPDGAGFAYRENDALHIEKGFYTLDKLREAFEPHETKQAILHFRIRSHGSFEKENCHPFNVTQNLVFAHNGVIYRMPVDKEDSDTVQFNELILKNIIRIYGKRVVYDKFFKHLLEGYASGSRFVFMDNKGSVSIINEDDGDWNSKCWFSNDSWSKPPVKERPIPPLPQQKSNVHYLPPTRSHADDVCDLPTERTTNFTPRKEPWRPLTIGDYVKVISEYQGVDPGALGKAMGFYPSGVVEVYFPIRRLMKKIPVMYLDRVTPTQIPPPSDGDLPT
jgi:hypothetical protein